MRPGRCYLALFHQLTALPSTLSDILESSPFFRLTETAFALRHIHSHLHNGSLRYPHRDLS